MTKEQMLEIRDMVVQMIRPYVEWTKSTLDNNILTLLQTASDPLIDWLSKVWYEKPTPVQAESFMSADLRTEVAAVGITPDQVYTIVAIIVQIIDIIRGWFKE